MTLATLDVPQALFSTLGRTAARTLETKIIADMMQGMYDATGREHQGRRHEDLQRASLGAGTLARGRRRGVGYMEAPRGGLRTTS
jgi:hydrogenase large subunit